MMLRFTIFLTALLTISACAIAPDPQHPQFTNLNTGEVIDILLDPQVFPIAVNAKQHPLPQDLTERRSEFNARIASLSSEAEPVKDIENIQVNVDDGQVSIRLYRPRSGTLPVLVYAHGGGFDKGSPASYDTVLRSLANASGIVIIGVDYHLAPEAKYPTQINETYDVLKWVTANAPALHIDPRHVMVGGDDAGGTIAAEVARRAHDEHGPKIAKQILIYPLMDMSLNSDSWAAFSKGPWLTRDMTLQETMEFYLPKNTDPKEESVSPVLITNVAGMPPAAIFIAQFDPLRDEGRAYAEHLKVDGVAVNIKTYPGMIHDFMLMGGKVDSAKELINDIAASLK